MVLAPGRSSARHADAGVALATSGDSDVGTASADGHTYAGKRKIELNTRQQFNAALETKAIYLFMSAQNVKFLQPLGTAGFCPAASGRVGCWAICPRLSVSIVFVLIVFLLDRVAVVTIHRSGWEKHQGKSSVIEFGGSTNIGSRT